MTRDPGAQTAPMNGLSSNLRDAVHLPQADIGRLREIYPPGHVLETHHLMGATSAAMIVDYERAAEHGGTFSRDFHYFDMTLSRRPKGALGRFVESSSDIRPVGQILFAPAGYHYAGQGGPGRQKSLAVIVERTHLAEEQDIDVAIAMGLPHCMNLEGESLIGLLRRIEREVLSPGFASALLLDGLCLSLMVETARALRASGARSTRKGGLSARNLKLIEERIHAGGSAPSLSELAHICRISQRQLVRAFHAETGHTIGDYVKRVTLERAQRLLATSSAPIADIAQQVGFSTPASFSTAFRRLCGQTPRAYRMQARTTGAHS